MEQLDNIEEFIATMGTVSIIEAESTEAPVIKPFLKISFYFADINHRQVDFVEIVKAGVKVEQEEEQSSTKDEIKELRAANKKFIKMIAVMNEDCGTALMFCWDYRALATSEEGAKVTPTKKSPSKVKVWKHSPVRIEHDGDNLSFYVRENEAVDAHKKDRRYISDIELCRIYHGFPVSDLGDYQELIEHVCVKGMRSFPCDTNGDPIDGKK